MPTNATKERLEPELVGAAVPKATSATNIFGPIGGSLVVPVFAVVLDTQISQRIGSRAGVAIQNGVTFATATQLDQIARAFGQSFWCSCGTCALGIIPALFLPRTPIVQRPVSRASALVVE